MNGLLLTSAQQFMPLVNIDPSTIVFTLINTALIVVHIGFSFNKVNIARMNKINAENAFEQERLEAQKQEQHEAELLKQNRIIRYYGRCCPCCEEKEGHHFEAITPVFFQEQANNKSDKSVFVLSVKERRTCGYGCCRYRNDAQSYTDRRRQRRNYRKFYRT